MYYYNVVTLHQSVRFSPSKHFGVVRENGKNGPHTQHTHTHTTYRLYRRVYGSVGCLLSDVSNERDLAVTKNPWGTIGCKDQKIRYTHINKNIHTHIHTRTRARACARIYTVA